MPKIRFVRIKIPLSVLIPLFIALFAPLLSVAQLKTISGTVTDAAGAPVEAVSVTVKGTTGGTQTDSKGHFTISAASGATLVFTSASFEDVTITVDNRTEYSVRLTQRVSSLTDVVVVGYGRQKKVNLVGAVGTVNVDEKITSRSVPNVSSALTGLVPGLSATQSSGMAGQNNAALLIRGLGTVNNASPLVVVDGMPDVDINRVNINDIETISVLKDATSASVYGSRAANGVILITTKTGKGAKRTAINFNSNMALIKPTKAADFMADYPRSLTLSQRRQATSTAPNSWSFRNGTIDQWMALGMIDPLRYPNTDWWDVILQDGAYQNYNLSAVGGDEKSNFYASVGMRNERGLQINNEYLQYNARFNFDYKLRKNMNTGFKFNGNWSRVQFALAEGFTDSDPNNTAGTDMQYAIAGITPYDPVSGNFGGVMSYGEDPQAYNPYTLYVNSLNRQTRQELNATGYIDWTPVKGLTATLDYNLIYYNMFGYTAAMPNTAFNFQTNSPGSRVYVGANAGISNNTWTGYKTLMNARLNYHTVFAKNHDVSAMFVYSEEYWYDRFQGSSRNDRLYPTLHEIDAALADIQTTGGNSSNEGLQSYIGRVNYAAWGKYLLEGNFRIDGSSKFLDGHRYGFFPSVAVGWRFTEEPFINRITDHFLSNGKLRLSYGSLGNNSGIGRYEQLPTLANRNYMTAGSVIRGFALSKFVNPDLTWENTAVLNLGLELGFMNNRLTAELDLYDRLTTDMIRGSTLSSLLQASYAAPNTNIATLRNRGIELTLTWKDNLGKDFYYGLTANGSYNRSRLEKWNELLTRGTTFIDMPYHFLYTYEDIGIAQTWDDVYKATPQGAQPGDILRKDLNGDGRITDDDRKAYPTINMDRPSTYFSLNGYASWKGFDIVFLLSGAAGRKNYIMNAYNNVNFSNTRYATSWDHWNKPWSIENRGGEWPRLGGSGNNVGTNAQTTLWLDDMSYLRFKNVQLGYSIPRNILRRAWINNLRIAGSAENLFTITKWRGLDPEKESSNNNVYPINKSYSLSVQLGF
jgi:TonB-dependent starch-binding outer membrane protein SusC